MTSSPSLIFIKTNFVDVLRRELDRPRWTRELAALGTATDPYQPIEGKYKLTRGTLQALAEGRTPVGLLTKGPMIVRDIDVLQDVFRTTSARASASASPRLTKTPGARSNPAQPTQCNGCVL